MSVKKEKIYIIKAHTINDADRVIVFLTENGKKKSAVAKNALRLKSRFAGRLDPYNFCLAEYYEKNEDSASLCRINSMEVIRSCFKSIGGDMQKFTAFSLISEVLNSFVYGNECGAKVFRLTDHCLSYLEQKDSNVAASLSYFMFWLMKLSGLMPDFGKCAVCSSELVNSSSCWLKDKEVFCSKHGGKGIEIKDSYLKTILKMEKSKLEDVVAAGDNFKELFQIVFTMLSLITEKEYKSYELLKAFL